MGLQLTFLLLQVVNPLFLKRTNSFQALVVTDGDNSYAIFVYHCCLMQWFGWRVAIGFNSDGFGLYENHPLSLLTDAGAVACLNRPFSDWTNVIYRLDNNTATTETTATPTTSMWICSMYIYGSLTGQPFFS